MRYLFIFFLILLVTSILPDHIFVPDQYPSVQSAIYAAAESDTIIVLPGTYYENIDYLGKEITIGSLFLFSQDSMYIEDTIIDGNQSGSVVTLNSGEGPNTKISGLTIRNGLADLGAGFYCYKICFDISDLHVHNNIAYTDGGGLYSKTSDITMHNCLFENNHAEDDGGGICCVTSSDLDMTDCIIAYNFCSDCGAGICTTGYSNLYQERSIIHDNLAVNDGGGIYQNSSQGLFIKNVYYNNHSIEGSGAFDLWWCYISIQNCTISHNHSLYWAGGISFWHATFGEIINTIISYNWGSGILSHEEANPYVSYCDLYANTQGDFQGYFPQENLGLIVEQNYNGDPCDRYSNIFLIPGYQDSFNHDYHLLESSSCIDAGSPYLPYDPDSTLSDIGAFYYNSQTASENQELDEEKNFFLKISPNPLILNSARSTEIDISYHLNINSYVEIIIYNIKGQRVKKLEGRRISGGDHETTWNGKDNKGMTVNSGIYLCSLKINSNTEDVIKFTLLR